MRSPIRNEIKIEEERRANKLFIFLFFVSVILYDVYRFIISPLIDPDTTMILLNESKELIPLMMIYAIEFSLIPISKWYSNREKPFATKYLFFVVFMTTALITEIFRYIGTDEMYASGSPVELFFVLFSPLFVNKRFYITVVAGITGKYAIMGFLTMSPIVVFPILILLLFSGITFIILNRFQSYLNTIVKSYEQAAHNEKLAFIGRIATGVTHEIKNPLTSLKGFVQLQELEQTYNPKYSKIMLQELERLTIIVNDLMVIGKPQSINLKPISLTNCLEYVVSLLQQEAENKQITIYTNFPEEQVQIMGEDVRLKQVILNLVKNAMEAMPDGGEIRLKLVNDGDWTTIHIMDRGVGIAEEDIPHLDQAFYTTKENGTGLGLMVSYKIVEDHHGKIDVHSEVNHGTTFSISFPILSHSLDNTVVNLASYQGNKEHTL
ncbi:ATP-binding protein [Guptibacillus hwajinpoensis]|uniref:ATP-binding protein n=1 Tax=Guptibacillus hwajinpoensis TaxID=208199 RepID=UPI0024B32533|nr:ATP-binding protein [Pseudalkalibacillus hwajinpoensis]